ncbi:dehydrogenase [Rhodococcus rhodnii LMG 5362]|uniref:Dehydrogenase n=2 Tax=Rhodococcus rhodnii TaxID=38312 RepID=R7WR16_9NOCA|nr:dehydrogenase [Rhodococcus rhodnii LMG 5362]
MGMSAFYGPADHEQNKQVLAHAADNGITLFDTADMYGDGANELLVGEFLRGRSEDSIVATKVGFRTDPERGKIVDNDPTYIRQACEASLRRLGVDTIDLYYLHRRNPDVPIEDSVGTMRDLLQEGKIRNIGLSEVNAATLDAACAVTPIAALQIEYSLTERSAERELIPAARAHDVAVVAYSPLGRGLLTGRFADESHFASDDFRPKVHPRLHGDNLAANMAIVERFGAIAAELGLPKSSVALAWLLSRGDDIVPIPGTRSIAYLQQNIDAASVHLSPDVLADIEDVFHHDAIVGSRYDEAGLAFLDH